MSSFVGPFSDEELKELGGSKSLAEVAIKWNIQLKYPLKEDIYSARAWHILYQTLKKAGEIWRKKDSWQFLFQE